LSFKPVTARYCEFPLLCCNFLLTRHASGRIAKLASASPTSLTTLQKEILRLVIIIASLAILVSVLIVILWAAW
jgi:hypothetical protein